MTSALFDRSLAAVLRHEGGFSDHPSDPGGATMQGVTQNVYDAYRASEGQPRRSVEMIEPEELQTIYREGYWTAAACDRLPPGVDYITFDTAVNMGVSRAKRYLQTAAAVKADGTIGPVTLAAAGRLDPRVLVGLIAAQRKAFYLSSPNFATFGKGWLRRLEEVAHQAEEWSR